MDLLGTLLTIFVYLLSAALMVAGLALTVINFPGIWLIFTGVLISAAVQDFEKISPLVLIFFFLISLISTFIDNVTVAWGAKSMGAGRWGIAGAFAGAILGFFIGNIFGLLLGPFVGAFLFELAFAKKELNAALKSGFGTFVGFLFGIVLKLGVGIAMICTWLLLIF